MCSWMHFVRKMVSRIQRMLVVIAKTASLYKVSQHLSSLSQAAIETIKKENSHNNRRYCPYGNITEVPALPQWRTIIMVARETKRVDDDHIDLTITVLNWTSQCNHGSQSLPCFTGSQDIPCRSLSPTSWQSEPGSNRDNQKKKEKKTTIKIDNTAPMVTQLKFTFMPATPQWRGLQTNEERWWWLYWPDYDGTNLNITMYLHSNANVGFSPNLASQAPKEITFTIIIV